MTLKIFFSVTAKVMHDCMATCRERRFYFHDFVCRYLCGKFSGSRDINLQQFLSEWQREVWWKWAGQMSSQVDRNRYWEIISHAVRKYFDQDNLVSGGRSCWCCSYNACSTPFLQAVISAAHADVHKSKQLLHLWPARHFTCVLFSDSIYHPLWSVL